MFDRDFPFVSFMDQKRWRHSKQTEVDLCTLRGQTLNDARKKETSPLSSPHISGDPSMGIPHTGTGNPSPTSKLDNIAGETGSDCPVTNTKR